MPGLVKVGRTNRAPTDRLAELSSATGVPTPFELVYDVLVPDAQAAEAFLHVKLTAAGFRVSENREFFQAPIRDVVRLMIHLRETLESTRLFLEQSGDYVIVSADDEGDAFDRDDLFFEAATICIRAREGSSSLLQRQLKVGYGRAARMIDQLHSAGVLGPPDGSQPRRVLIGEGDLVRLRG